MVGGMRIAIAAVAVGAAAAACGAGGGGHAPGRLDVRAAVRRGACLPVHPGLSPYRGPIVLVRADGHRVRVNAGPSGRGQVSLAAGSYRVVAPLAGSTIRVQLDGRAVAAGGRYPLRIAGGRTARLAVVILPRRGDCTSLGTVS
jgi:hypothetical protein